VIPVALHVSKTGIGDAGYGKKPDIRLIDYAL
jgi:hypothetical protein